MTKPGSYQIAGFMVDDAGDDIGYESMEKSLERELYPQPAVQSGGFYDAGGCLFCDAGRSGVDLWQDELKGMPGPLD